MKEQEKLIKHFEKFGKTGSWFELAKQFDILPNASRKQRSDKARKICSRYVKYIPKQVYQRTIINPVQTGNTNNVLIIGDLHTPFELDGYLDFCKKQKEKYDCGTVIFIGDLIDSHFSSFHETDPDGMSAGMELTKAINKLQKWYKEFPNAIITIGNHDRIIARKLYTSGISARWLRPIEEVLNTPNWKFVEEFVHNNILYLHGEGGTAKTKAQQEHISVVQGHNHTDCYIDFNMTRQGVKFSMQVGTGIDFKSYAFGYAQRGKCPMTSCAVVLDNQPLIIPYQ